MTVASKEATRPHEAAPSRNGSHRLEILDRTPPSDVAAEKALLGGMMNYERISAAIASTLSWQDFYTEPHRLIAKHVWAIVQAGMEPALADVLKRLEDSGELDDVGGEPYLRNLYLGAGMATNLPHYLGTVRDAAAKRRLIQVGLDIIQDASARDVSAAEAVDRAKARVESTADRVQRLSYRTMTAAELVSARFDLRYLIDHIIVESQPLIVAGPKKSLKTSILIDLAVSLAMGGCFLGKFKVAESVRVGIMTGESGLPTVQETFLRICRAAGYDPASVGRLVVTDQVPIFASAEHQAAIKGWAMEHELQVLIIDPAYMCLDGTDAGNLFVMGERLRAISQVCRDCGLTLVLAHHMKRGVANPHQPGELDDIAWSGFAEFARQWLLLSRREAYTPGTGQHRLWLTSGGSAGHSGLWALDVDEGTRQSDGGRFWEVQVSEAEDARSEAQAKREAEKDARAEERARQRLANDVNRLGAAFGKYPAGETARTLRDTAGISATRFNIALAEMIQSRAVVECQVFKSDRRTPRQGYRWADGNIPL